MADTEEQTTALDFGDAFTRLTSLGEQPSATAVAEALQPTEAPTGAGAATTTEPAAENTAAEGLESTGDDEGAAGAEAPAGEQAGETSPTTPTPTPAASLTAEEMLAKIAAAVTERPEPPAPKAEEPPAPESVYSPEEQQAITKYMEEWPEVAQAEATIRRGEYKHLVEYVFSQMKAYLKPFEETVGTLAAETQAQQILQQVPDYNTVDRNAVIEWVGKQPAYLQKAYQDVIERGTTDEVVDLIQRYRQSTTPAAPAATGKPAAPATPAAPRKVEPALPADAKQAASSLAPVGSKRSAVAPIVEPSDFDAGFEAALKLT